MSTVWQALVIIANVVLETVALDTGRFLWGIHIDLTAAIVTAYALVSGPRKGSVYGLIVGLILDMLTGTGVGILALGYFAMGLLCGLFNGRFYAQNKVFPAILALFATLGKEAYLMLVTSMQKIEFHAVTMIWRYIVPGAVLTALITLPIYVAYSRIKKSQLRRTR